MKQVSIGSRAHRRLQAQGQGRKRRLGRVGRVGLTTAMAAGMLPMLPAAPASAATFNVTTLDYYGEGGLAEAIANANAAPDVDVITFGVTGTIVVPETVWLQYSTIIHGAGITLTSGPEFVEGALLLVQRYEADTNVSSIDGLTIQTTEFFVDGINATNVDLTLSSVTLSGTGVFADDTQLHVDQSLIDSSARSGIAVDGYSSTLAMTSSTIRGSGGAAIWVAYIESMEISSSTISGSGHSGVRVEYVDSVTITDSQITGNGHVAPNDGGGVYLNDVNTATISDSTISENYAWQGGGIAARDTDLSVSSSTISDNETIEDGGGGLSSWGYGSVSIDNSTISGNRTVWRGGGIETDNDLTISNSTITGNTADGEGGGIALYGATLTIANSTLVGNSGEGADEILAPIADDFTAVSIVNSVVSGSTESPSPDLVVYGETNIDHSLVREPGELVVPLDAGNLIGVDPLLGPLANNGGSTLTMLPQTGSPVIDAGDPAFEGTGTDQRGQARVFNGAVDMGAVEVGTTCGLNSFTPIRVVDTRSSSKMGPGETRAVQVAGVGGLPSDGITAAIVNITATNSSSSSFVTAWASDADMPATSSLNTEPGVNVPNLAIVQVGADGKINLYNHAGTTDVIVDVMGFLGSCSPFVPVAPQRLLDTRSGLGAPVGKVGAGQSLTVATLGHGGLPATGVGAVVVNITSTEATASSFVTAWPSGETRPDASSLNTDPGVDVPSLAVVMVGADGNFNLFNEAGSTHLLVDVVGYFPSMVTMTATDTAMYTPMVPTRVLDSRRGFGFFGPAVSGTPYEVDLSGMVPAGTKAVIMNLTGTGTTAAGYVTAWEAGTTMPGTSNLNTEVATNVSNLVVVKLSPTGKATIQTTGGSTHLVADIVGYFPGTVVPV